VIRALKNKATNTTHLATDAGQPWCGTRVDRRLLPFEVRRPEEINCDKCRRSEAFKFHALIRNTGADAEQADELAGKFKPPRLRDQSKTGPPSRVRPQS